jgi:hypothetical protein
VAALDCGMKEKRESPDAGIQGLASRGIRPARRRHHGWRVFLIVILVLVGVGTITRAVLPTAVRDYVNRTLDRNLLYEGRIGHVQIHLLRGAYSIDDVRISHRTGQLPVPVLSAKRVEFAIEWRALVHGRVVGQFELDAPELNFVASNDESQEKAGGAWLQTIRDLFPFTINSAVVHDGAVHFRAFQSKTPVDIYLSHLEGTIDNLSNIRKETQTLVTKVQATALAMDQAQLQYKMTLDPFSYRPTFHLAVRLLGLDVTKLNALALAYGKFDFKRGWFDLVLEADSKEGQLTGYVTPLFRNLKIFSLSQDIKEDNVLQFFWQALVGGATTVLKNVPHDQFGTLIPFTGDLSGTTQADILAAVGNILRNAFVRAYLPRLQPGVAPTEDFHFEPPSLITALSTTDASPR